MLDAATEEFEGLSGEIKILNQVGEGSTAKVYRAEWNNQIIALKQFTGSESWSKDARKSACRELSILQKVKHPHLANCLGFIKDGSKFQVAMEFCEGGDGFDLLHDQEDFELRWSQKSKIALDTAQAMNYLHALKPPIIHRDLKSMNLLLEKRLKSSEDVPAVKVADFGYARTLTSRTHLTRARGTFHWMAPELFKCDKYDIRVDVYSYGVLLYEIICEALPFEDVDHVKIGPMVCNGVRPDLKEVPQDCLVEFTDIMVACWAQEPQDRPFFDAILPSIESIHAVFGVCDKVQRQNMRKVA